MGATCSQTLDWGVCEYRRNTQITQTDPQLCSDSFHTTLENHHGNILPFYPLVQTVYGASFVVYEEWVGLVMVSVYREWVGLVMVSV